MALAERYVERTNCTEEEYFEIERTSFGRWEYVSGEIRLMAGGTPDHGAIGMNIGRALGNALVPRGCRVYGPDIKVHTGSGVNTFPDVSTFCGPHHYYAGRNDILLNPLLIVEVLSPSTEAYDRGEKFDHYKTIETLTDYLLAAQDEPKITVYTRRAGGWEERVIVGINESVFLPSVNVTLALTDIYALIEFGTEQP